MIKFFIILTFFLYPALSIYLSYKNSFINKIGVVILCYLGGMFIGNFGFIPSNFGPIQQTLSEATVAISLPLLLFSIDVKKWSRLAGKAILSMILATGSILVVSFILFMIIKSHKPEIAWQLVGMAVGLYTGGTPNLAAIKTGLAIDNSTYILFHTYDTIISLLFILFVVSIAQRLFNKFLPMFKKDNIISDKISEESIQDENEDIENYKNIFSKKIIIPLLGALLFSILIVIASIGLSQIFPKKYSASITILLITTFGIGSSFILKIRNIKKTFQLGMYIIYIFCFIVGSMTDFSLIEKINYTILFFVTSAIFGAMFLHALLCKIFKIDTDTFLITSTAAICSPPFVPVVAGALKNKPVILSGLTTGIIGYAIGNYLGITFAYLLKSLFG